MGQAPAETLAAPSFFELVEATVTAGVKPFAAFEAAAARPAASFLTATTNGLVWFGIFFAVNLVHASVAYPGKISQAAAVTGLGSTAVAVVAVFAFFVAILGMAVSASGLAGLARVMGGQGGFSRAYQAVSMMGILLPVQAMILWFPMAGFIPVIATGVLAAAALEKSLGAKPAPARLVCGGYVVFVLSSLLALNYALKQLAAPYMDAAKMMEQLDKPGGVEAAAQGASGLGLVSPPADLADMMSKMGQQDPQALGRAAGGLVGAAQPMLNDPKMLEGLTTEQRQQVQQLSGMLETIQKQMQSGQPMDPKQQAQLMELYQKQMGGMQNPEPAQGQGR